MRKGRERRCRWRRGRRLYVSGNKRCKLRHEMVGRCNHPFRRTFPPRITWRDTLSIHTSRFRSLNQKNTLHKIRTFSLPTVNLPTSAFLLEARSVCLLRIQCQARRILKSPVAIGVSGELREEYTSRVLNMGG